MNVHANLPPLTAKSTCNPLHFSFFPQMTKPTNLVFHLKRCACGAVVRGPQFKAHFSKDGHVATQHVIACSSCEVVPSDADLKSGKFRAAHHSCPVLRANCGKVSLFLNRIKNGGNTVRPDLAVSPPAQMPVRTPGELGETAAAVRTILPSPIVAETDDDVDLDRTPRAERVNIILLPDSDDEQGPALIGNLAPRLPVSSTPAHIPAASVPAAVAVAPAASAPAPSAAATPSAVAAKTAVASSRAATPSTAAATKAAATSSRAAAAPSKAAGATLASARAISQTTEVVLLQDRNRSLRSDLERLRKEVAAAQEKGRLANRLQQQLEDLKGECDRLCRERDESNAALVLERDRSADYWSEMVMAQDEARTLKRRLAEAEARTAPASPARSPVTTAEAATQTTAPAAATPSTGRSYSWLLHVPVRDKVMVHDEVFIHRTDKSFMCPEDSAMDLTCNEILLRVTPNMGIQYEVFKKRRSKPNCGPPPPKRPR